MGPFWPDQVLKDAIVATIVFVVLLTLVVFLPYQFSGPADPFDTSFVPKPEWNFLFLYEALKYFQGPLEPIGVAGVPGLLILLLVLLPFIDRNPERNPFRRPLVLSCGFAIAGVITALSVAGYLSPGYGTPAATGVVKTVQTTTVPWGLTALARADTVSPPTPGDSTQAADAPLTGTAAPAPPVSGEAGDAAYIIGSAGRGEILFSDQCSGCHGEAGKEGLPNPGSIGGTVPALDPIDQSLFARDPSTFAGNIDRVIQHGSVPEGSPAFAMPDFGDSGTLNQQQIANLIAYIMAINGVDRAMITRPGIRPGTFYLMAVSVLLLLGLALAGAWSKKAGPRAGKSTERGSG